MPDYKSVIVSSNKNRKKKKKKVSMSEEELFLMRKLYLWKMNEKPF